VPQGTEEPMADVAQEPSGPLTARRAGLLYVSDSDPGIQRRRCGRGFTYLYADGRPVRSDSILERLEALAIPPAWDDVWICRSHRGHLQATGRDDLGRKQYIYHPRWQEATAEQKYGKLLVFGQTLPRLRRKLMQQVAEPEPTLERTAAAALLLMDRTAIRVGNEEYARRNRSYGLTTLRRTHLRECDAGVRLRFVGKSGLWHDFTISDPLLVSLLQQYAALPGKNLFKYRGADGRLVRIGASHVNQELRRLSGLDITAKDFRTWKASALVAGHLFDAVSRGECSPPRRVIGAAVSGASELLGNTATVCRHSYIVPRLLDSFLNCEFTEFCKRQKPRDSRWMSRHERVLLEFLATEQACAAAME